MATCFSQRDLNDVLYKQRLELTVKADCMWTLFWHILGLALLIIIRWMRVKGKNCAEDEHRKRGSRITPLRHHIQS